MTASATATLDAPVDRLLGLDENGLGSRLGPMIVTAVRLDVDRTVCADRKALKRVTTRAAIGDSKDRCAHGDMGDVEGQVLALLDVHLGVRPTSLDGLMEAIGLDAMDWLRAPCPEGHAPQACFAEAVLLPTFGDGVTDAHRKSAETLVRKGVRMMDAKTTATCARRLNDARAVGQSRFDLDLACMVRLIRDLASRTTGTMEIACGKVGGRMHYSAGIEALAPLIGVLEEKPKRSSYSVPRLGIVSFVMDGDASEPAVALASMIGKYVRELWMRRIHAHYSGHVDDLEEVSGYHDPATARFVDATALVRRTRGVPDVCFER
jgi:ribonuclease HII